MTPHVLGDDLAATGPVGAQPALDRVRGDDEFVATVAEFASLSWLASSQVDALRGLQTLLTEVIDDMVEQGEDVPAPFPERSYSGKFNLRLGESLHRDVALRAAEENLSINQWVVRRLLANS